MRILSRRIMLTVGASMAGFLLTCRGATPQGRLQTIEQTIHTAQPPGGYYPVYDPDAGFWPYDSFFWAPIYYYPYPYAYAEYPAGAAPPVPAKRLSFIAGFHYFYDIEGDLDGFRGSGRLRTAVGALDGDFTRFREDLDPGNYYLNLFYIDYLFPFTLPPVIIEVGLGYTGLWGQYHQDGGNFTCSLQVVPIHPLIFECGARYSNVHNSPITDLTAGVGVIFHFAELRLGYRYLFFEGPDIRGPEAGVRLWF